MAVNSAARLTAQGWAEILVARKTKSVAFRRSRVMTARPAFLPKTRSCCRKCRRTPPLSASRRASSRCHTVEAGENSITVDGKEIIIYANPNPAELPWGEIGVDVVLECTGFFCSKAKAQAHIDAGAKKVVISAPAGNDLPTIVYSVNENTLTAEDTIISAASCTTNCLAPMAKALNDYAAIQSGIMTTVHAYTGDQMVLDGLRRLPDCFHC